MKTKVAYGGVLTALALIFSYVESLIPITIGIPGVKLGLANLLIVFALYKLDTKMALTISVIRILLSGFMFGNAFSIVYSLAGGLVSFLAMICFKRTKAFSAVGVSISGGVFHNIGQMIVAIMVVESYYVGYYLPVLIIAGAITGLLIGIVTEAVLFRIKSLNFK